MTDVWETDRITSVLLRLPESDRRDIETIQNLLVDGPSSQRVRLCQIARIDRGEGPQTIFRENLVVIFFVQIVFPVLHEWCASPNAGSHAGASLRPPEPIP
jgi:Cu/Ag efflux pump CusA